MQLKIQVIKVSVEQTAKYSMAEVTFKNLDSGKVESRKLPSFKNASVFDTFKNAVDGDTFTVTAEKPDGEKYWAWVSAVKGATGSPTTEFTSPSPAAAKGNTSPRSTYETPEERAARQVYIIKQSSLTSAIATLSVGSKALDEDKVISLARKYVDFVLGNDATSKLLEMPSDDVTLDIPGA